jgi:hypothetical protein
MSNQTDRSDPADLAEQRSVSKIAHKRLIGKRGEGYHPGSMRVGMMPAS